MDVRELKENRIIQLKNPFKSPITWKGDWSHHSKKWTPELRELLLNDESSNSDKLRSSTDQLDAFNSESQDVFWMPFIDFTRYFHSVDICKLRNDWRDKRITGSFILNTEYDETSLHANQLKVYRLFIFDRTRIDLSLFNCKSSNKNPACDSDLCILVFRTATEVSQLKVGEIIFSSRHVLKGYISCEYTFEAGEYFLVPVSFNSWFNHANNTVIAYDDYPIKNKFYNAFNLVIYSDREFFADEEYHSNLFLADAVIEFCLKMGNKEDIGLDKASIYTLTKGFEGGRGFVFVYFQLEFYYIYIQLL